VGVLPVVRRVLDSLGVAPRAASPFRPTQEKQVNDLKSDAVVRYGDSVGRLSPPPPLLSCVLTARHSFFLSSLLSP